jgi:hypothetical protein
MTETLDLDAIKGKLHRALGTAALSFPLRDVQVNALYAAAHGGVFGAIRVGGGKCLGRDTPVLMFDGSVKAVQDIKSGDRLMGPDSNPRTVETVCSGREPLYKVTPVKGDSFVVNVSHILSIKHTPELLGQSHTTENISIRDLLGKSLHWRANAKLWRTGVDFAPSTPLPIPAYILGLWLGDGNSSGPAITTTDHEISSAFIAWGATLGLHYRETRGPGTPTYYLTHSKKHKANPALDLLRGLNVVNNKHIPEQYLTASRGERLDLLAGIIDTDGHLGHNYDYISVSERLADNVVFLCRSLGLAAYKKETQKECVNNGKWGTYYRVSISGDLNIVPCRLEYKRAAPREQKKSHLVTGFSLEPLGTGEYYGFELSGPDRLFLLGDFTVTHNTLISLLAPVVMQASRPVLLCPASLVDKTEADRRRYAKDYRVAQHLRILSYEMLGRVRMAEELQRYQPDLIIADEVHRLKNKKAACTRRVTRYMKERPATKFVALSGTVMKRSIKDFAHILRWCLKENAPVPLEDGELEEWSQALDDQANPLAQMHPGPLGEDRETARAWFSKRLASTPGVVIADAGKDTAASLRLVPLEYPVNAATEAAFAQLRATWTTPNGYAFSEAIMLWKFARELALGHYITWDPPAPADWLDARKAWAGFAREVLSRSRTYDTELQVRLAVQSGNLDAGTDALADWLRVQKSFTPNPVDTWQDDGALEACESWAKGRPGIVFTGHSFFGRALARRLNAPYYGEQGKDDKGNAIEAEDGSKVIVASLQANGTGRNLQAFSRALVTTNVNGGDQLEQLIGRLHRQGQTADDVEFTFLIGCFEHVDGFARAVDNTQTLAQLTNQNYKLSYADITLPGRETLMSRAGARWTKQATNQTEELNG